ncbi:MAG TPA: hypothetical protein DCM28_05570 [Phycisphaerales bacterium]|mgnify:CR=1 FL=1|nr:hypothetical protein [Phycisphaerales bacterium]|tara:strand:- start:114 stop:1178 length:1065 start_codon:yes stop_codon:yes gene_type:complete
MSVSQRDIALELNLSVATVSKSLRNSPEIPPTTRAQVIDTASKLGYRPSPNRQQNMAQKNAANPRSVQVGFLVQSDESADSPNVYSSSMVLAGISEAAQASDASLSVYYVPLADRDRLDDSACQPVAMREGLLSGLILYNYYPSHIVRSLSACLPCVHVLHRTPGLNVDCVELDSEMAIGQLMSHLHQLGHRRIGYLGGWSDQSHAQARFAAYVQSLVRLGLPFDPSISLDLLDTFGADEQPDHVTEKRVIELTQQGVTAWVTTNAHLALQWHTCLTQAGLRVPEDVSLCGIHGQPNALSVPDMTSVDLPYAELGRAAMDLVLRRIKCPTAPVQRVGYQGIFIEGKTVTKPRDI